MSKKEIMDIVNRGYPIDRSLEYRGVSGSVNIISYLLLMKLPFIYYLSIVNKKSSEAIIDKTYMPLPE